ncbi:hypothetical protein N7540_001657 [Penicillium herquei]|nr:hypothetical protein N7540_001657 [Penicillium herquei]
MADSFSPELQRLIDTLTVIAPELAIEVSTAFEAQRFGGIMFELPAHILQYPMDDENHNPTTFIEWVTNNFEMVDERVAEELGYPTFIGSDPNAPNDDNGPINWRPVIWGLPADNSQGSAGPICEHCLDLLDRQPADADLIAEHPTCPICAEDIEQNAIMINLPCRHLFHEQCITLWLHRSSTCPLCRRVIKNL